MTHINGNPLTSQVSINKPPLTTQPVPLKLSRRPKHNGMPVPYFVAWFVTNPVTDKRYEVPEGTTDAVPDFRVVSNFNGMRARRDGLCWICGGNMAAYKSFVFGPAAAMHRLSAEPPSHRECGRASMLMCPHIGNPAHSRRDEGLPEVAEEIGEVADHNPGVYVLWTTRSWRPWANDPRLISIGDPTSIEWWCHKRLATRQECIDALDTTIALTFRQQFGDRMGITLSEYRQMIEPKRLALMRYLPE